MRRRSRMNAFGWWWWEHRARTVGFCSVALLADVALKRLFHSVALLVDVVDGASVGAANLLKFGGSAQLMLGFGAPKKYSPCCCLGLNCLVKGRRGAKTLLSRAFWRAGGVFQYMVVDVCSGSRSTLSFGACDGSAGRI